MFIFFYNNKHYATHVHIKIAYTACDTVLRAKTLFKNLIA